MGHRHVKTPAARVGAVAFFLLCFSLCCAVPLTGLAGESTAQVDAEPAPTLARHAPPDVPPGYVVTPFGYFHPSCVRTIARSDVLLADGRIKHADGTSAPVRTCAYARYMQNGRRIEPGMPPQAIAAPLDGRKTVPPEADGWLEASWYHDAAPFGGISADWLVPSAPTLDIGQVLYYFPGLEDYENIVTILQPVLGWNAFNDHGWTIASWNCCRGGNADHSVPEPTATGNLIVGTISGDCPAGHVCSTWDIVTFDKTRGRASTLKRASSYGQTFDWAFAGVVEVYGVGACDQYSSNGFVDFTKVSLLNVDKKAMRKVRWAASGLLQGGAPTCNYGVTVTPTSASLTF